MGGDRSAWMGLFLFVLIALAPSVMFWLALRLLPAVGSRLTERFARHRALPGPTLQDIVADVRRLRREVCDEVPRTQVRRIALLAAYDGALLDACRIVDVPDPPLADASPRERSLARLLTEAALEDAGILLDPPLRN